MAAGGAEHAGELSADQPIRDSGEDRLSRGPLVDVLKDEIRNAPTADGFVMALTAPWGEGKTSVLNLIADALGEEMAVVRFNPWLFSDTETLVVRFFGEIGAQVQKDQSLRRVGKRLLSYGQAVAPLGALLVGPAANAAGQTLGSLAALGTRNALEEKEQLREALVQRERRLLVLIDDIDRLHQQEILDVFRLVKLVGDLPYVTYLMAFDRPYVEETIEKGRQADGRSYLEKVIQVSYDLPAIRPSEIEEVLLEKLNRIVSNLDHLPINEDRWSEIWSRGVAPFFRNLRDVARYASGVSTRVRLLGREVALEDILGLETLRVFEPQLHQLLPDLVESLTKQRTDPFTNEDAAKKRDQERIEQLVETASEPRRERVRALLRLLFPRAFETHFGSDGEISAEWRATRRVAYAPAFRAYLHASIDPGSASYATVIAAVDTFGEPDRLRSLLDSLTTSELQDLVERFRDFKDRLDPSSVRSGVSELLRLQGRLSGEWEGLRPAPQIFLKVAIFNSLEALPEGEREAAVRDAYEVAEKDSERYSLLLWFGTHPQRERRQPEVELLSEAATQELEEDLGARLRLREIEELTEERDFPWLIALAYGRNDDTRRDLDERANDEFALALLRTCIGWSMDGHSIFSVQKAEVFFQRPVLGRRVEQLLEENLDEEDREILQMAQEALAQPPSS